jgi:hypothetical protein
MSDKMFSSGLLNASNDLLAQMLVMWDDVTLWNSIWHLAKGKIEGDDTLAKELSDNKLKLLNNNANNMKLNILYRLSNHADITIPENLTIGDFERLGEKIVTKAVQLLKETDSSFKGDNLQDMARYIIQKQFDDLSKKFAEKDQTTQSKVVKELVDIIKSMPDGDRQRLLKELKVDELTDDAVKQALISGSLGTAFGVVIEVAGFSAYIFAVKALAITTGLIGITLPFAVYTTLTSLIAVISNPIFLIFAALGLGWWLTKRGNRQIKDRLLPVVVTMISTSAMLDKPIENQMKSIITDHEKIIKTYSEAISSNNYTLKSNLENNYPGITVLKGN